jgi:hypothetical protein
MKKEKIGGYVAQVESDMGNKKLIVMVSSTVYGIEELLNRVYALLTGFGYEVWMSHKGTVQTFSSRSTFEDSLAAVADCDLFLSVITPQYGSGKHDDGLSITHQELLKAIELKKPRWVLAHDHVVFARSFLAGLRQAPPSGSADTILRKLNRGGLSLVEGCKVMDDLRVIDMYDAATRQHLPQGSREGNWVQKYWDDSDALLYATAQFSRYQEVEKFVTENFNDIAVVVKSVKREEQA